MKFILDNDTIVLDGEVFNSFDRVEKIIEIILLGKDGGIRRICLK